MRCRPVVLLIGVMLLIPRWAAADCSLTESGFSAHPYTRSPAHYSAGLVAVQGIVPRDAQGAPSPAGRIRMIGIGMSNAQEPQQVERRELRYAPDRAPQFGFISAAQAGKTALEWANRTHAVWTNAVNKVVAEGSTRFQVQAAEVVMTQAFPDVNGVMTWAQLDAIVGNLKFYFPHLAYIELSSIGYTYYASPNDSRAPVWSVRGDVDLMVEYVLAGAAPTGVWIDLRDIWANGLTANPATSSVSWPAGLTYVCPADFTADLLHPSQTGADKLGRNRVERWRADPVTYGWMFAYPPPPPPAPAARGVLDDATLSAESGCILTGGLPHQGARIVVLAVPPDWCTGL